MENSKVFNGKDFSHQLRPAWTPINLALMIFFFVTGLWVLGIAMIAYMMYGKEIGLDFSNWGRAKSSVNKAFRDSGFSGSHASTGNAAFDAWRDEELRRLDEERRKLDEARKNFDEYVAELRRARDREEFESFRNNWKPNRTEGDAPAA